MNCVEFTSPFADVGLEWLIMTSALQVAALLVARIHTDFRVVLCRLSLLLGRTFSKDVVKDTAKWPKNNLHLFYSNHD